MILFFGAPGSGKSSQGRLLAARNNWEWLSTGLLFRHTAEPTVLSQLAKGDLVDNELANRKVDEKLQRISNTTNVILDGYPRNIAQANWLLDNLATYKRKIEVALVFEVPSEELLKRLVGRGRHEDSPSIARKRLDLYAKNIGSILDLYKKLHIPICSVSGLGTVNEVHERIRAAVEKYV